MRKRSPKPLREAMLLALLGAMLVQEASAAEFTVYDAPAFTNALLTAATNNEDDIVNVIAGYYLLGGDPIFDSSEPYSLHIRNRYGTVTLDAGGLFRGLYIYSRANSSNAWVRVSGLTFQNGFVNNSSGANAFIRTQSGNIIVEGCRFINGHSGSLFGSSHAAGLFARADNAGTTTVRRCTFAHNTAKGDGGGCSMLGANLLLENSVFSDNEGAARGGGAYLYSVSGNVLARNNTFVCNTTGGTGYGGGGLHVALYSDSASAAILNNIAWSNNADNALGEDIYIEDDALGNGTGATVLVQANLYTDLDRHVGDHLSLGSVLNTNPLLEADYRLLPASPCVDAGTNCPDLLWDRAGVSRPLDGNMDGMPQMDIGAFEHVPVSARATNAAAGWELLYSSSNLATHGISFECSPGDPTTNCPCGTDDVARVSHPTYAEVTSNVRLTNVFVNAIAYQRFLDSFPDGSPLKLEVFKYKADVRLPVLPAPIVSQTQNAQTVQMMIQMWDGTNRVWTANRHAMEATTYWSLGPWESNYQGNVLVYTDTAGSLELVETGITLPPDTNWHRFEMVADFSNRKWISLRVDDQLADITSVVIPLLERTNWGPEVLYHITQESCATYPGPGYYNVFSWTTEFRNIEFYRLRFGLEYEGRPPPDPMEISWHSEPFVRYRISESTNLATWSIHSNCLAGSGTSLSHTATTTNIDRSFYRVGVTP